MQVTSSMVEAALGSFFKDKDMRAALEAALSVADAPAPDDAAFGDAVEQFSIAKDLQCMAAQDGFIGDSRSVNAARVRVLALYADARNAGLRELRETLVARKERIVADDPERSPHSDLAFGVYLEEHEYILEQIDAMLKGGDGATVEGRRPG